MEDDLPSLEFYMGIRPYNNTLNAIIYQDEDINLQEEDSTNKDDEGFESDDEPPALV